MDVGGASKFLKITGNGAMEILYKDQQEELKLNSTNVHLICDDGFIPVHRLVLLNASNFFAKLLEKDKEGSEEVVGISLNGVKLKHASQIVMLLYTGKTYVSYEDRYEVYTLLTSLEIGNGKKVDCREVSESDVEPIQIRAYPREKYQPPEHLLKCDVRANHDLETKERKFLHRFVQNGTVYDLFCDRRNSNNMIAFPAIL